MNDESLSVSKYWRWSVYGLLIAVSVGTMTARVMQVESASRADPSPFLSANDKSRWATIRALVDEGTYVIDNIIFKEYGNFDDLAERTDQRDPIWHSIDVVYHRGSDGKWHYYSSKPTLLPTLLAGEYWLIKTVTGATLEEKPFYVVRLMLLFTNVIPLGLALAALAWLAEKYGTTDWGRMFVVACGCGATCMTTFAVALNNHLPAAVSAMFTLACLLPICWQRQEEWWRFAGAGLCAAFTAACELPALAFFVVVASMLVQRSPRQALIWFVPPALLVAAAAVGTNYLAHGTWKPPYAQRQDGKTVAKFPLDDKTPMIPAAPGDPSDQKLEPRIALPGELRQWLASGGVSVSPESWLEESRPNKRWVLVDPQSRERFAVIKDEDQEEIQVRQWGNWYEFPGSYWSSNNLQGVDRGEKSTVLYAVHCLIGHHGLFSLTPIWLLMVLGLGLAVTGRDRDWRELSVAVVLISLAVLAFYLSRSQIDRNYGGVSCCLRWMLWLAPLWLVAMLPAVDWASPSRRACWICLAFLAISAFSATYNSLNPFSHPWIFEYWQYLGWINY